MALQVKPRQHKDGRVYRLAVVIDHGKDKKTGKSNREYIYPKVAEYHTYGFDPMWPLQKARERLKQVQAQDKVERINNRKAKAQARIRERKLVDSAYLPEKLCREFEVFLSRKIGFGDGRLPSRIDSHWLGAQKMICEVQTEPKDYEEYSERFYQYVIKHKYSPSYLQKMLRIVNYWGYFVCRHQKQAFLPVRWPQGIWKERIADAYFDQRPHGLESAPLLPNELEKARSSLLTPAYNWLFISVWLGLRPSEIDALTDKKKMKNWRIEKDKQGITILRVYQPKLVSIEREKRWKGIPILFDQQVQALDFIKSGEFKRPLTKTIHLHISDRHNNYGGRKGFMDLMLSLGQKFENVSVWLGHTTLDRSLRNYKNKQIVNYDIPVKSGKPHLKRVK